MSMSNVIDTSLNIWVFVFIGLLVWLYFKKEPAEDGTANREDAPEDRTLS